MKIDWIIEDGQMDLSFSVSTLIKLIYSSTFRALVDSISILFKWHTEKKQFKANKQTRPAKFCKSRGQSPAAGQVIDVMTGNLLNQSPIV